MYRGISCCINSKLLMQNNGKPQPNCDKASCINNSSKKVHIITQSFRFQSINKIMALERKDTTALNKIVSKQQYACALN